MTNERYPTEDQMITAVTVKGGNVKVMAGAVVVSKRRGIVVRFEPDAEGDMPERGQTVTLLYGGGDRVLRLRTAVAEIIDGQKWLLEPVAEVTEGERREFLRADAGLRLSAEIVGPGHILPKESPPGANPDAWTERQVDLSGSGVKFLWDQICRKGDLVYLQMVLPLPAPTVVRAVGEVVRANLDQQRGLIDVAIHFTTVAELDRDLMINFVFRRYYEQLGLGATADPD